MILPENKKKELVTARIIEFAEALTSAFDITLTGESLELQEKTSGRTFRTSTHHVFKLYQENSVQNAAMKILSEAFNTAAILNCDHGLYDRVQIHLVPKYIKDHKKILTYGYGESDIAFRFFLPTEGKYITLTDFARYNISKDMLISKGTVNINTLPTLVESVSDYLNAILGYYPLANNFDNYWILTSPTHNLGANRMFSFGVLEYMFQKGMAPSKYICMSPWDIDSVLIKAVFNLREALLFRREIKNSYEILTYTDMEKKNLLSSDTFMYQQGSYALEKI